MTAAGAAALLVGGSVTAGDYGKAVIDDKCPVEAEPWSICNIFDYSTLYEGDGFIKEIALNGRYQGQAISQTEDYGGVDNGYHEWQHRRFRLGLDVEFANNITFFSSINVSDGSGGGPLTEGVFFDTWDEIGIEWEPSDDFYVHVGKMKQKITVENATSSKKILTIERSTVVNEVISDKPWGLTVGFELAGMSHEVGGWIGGADLDGTGERWDWPDADSRGGFTYRGSTDVSDSTELLWGYQFWNNSSGWASAGGSADSNLGSAYEHVAHIGTKSEWGDLGLITDLIYGANREASGLIPAGNDTFGVVILPYYNITDKLQAVARYAYMGDGREQRTQRYNVRQRLDNTHTFYVGLNYYICGDKLKVMGGYEYATSEEFGTGVDIDSSTWMFGVRTYW